MFPGMPLYFSSYLFYMFRPFYFVGFLSILFVVKSSNFSQLFNEKDIEFVPSYVENTFLKDLEDFSAKTKAFEKLLAANHPKNKIIEEQVIAIRMAYKKVEFLAEYLDPYFCKYQMNGAPLPKTEPKVPEIVILEPSGLQVLDELAFSEEMDYKELEKQINKINTAISRFIQVQNNIINLENRYILEACRYQIVRMFTLGLTGFDTPGSVNAIPEAITSSKAILQTLKLYEGLSDDLAANKSLQSVVRKLQYFIGYLKTHRDFEQLDRLHILTEYINPLYAELYQFHKSLQIEFPEEADPTLSAVNYHVTNLFDQDLLDPGFYSSLPPNSLADQKRFELGMLLFFDPILSSKNNLACSSCHQPNKGFTDGEQRSKGNKNGSTVLRNAPTILNSVYSTAYFWDLREHNLERQVKHVVMDELEFDTDFFEIEDKLNQSAEYVEMFEEAYPTYGLSRWSISNALACYVAEQNGWNSSFDQYVRGETNQIKTEVANGFNLFMGKAACGTCHFAPTFNGTVPPTYQDSESEVLGVPASKDTIDAIIDPDLGRVANHKPTDEAAFHLFSFKTPTIRNVELTAPYMHNGVYSTLEEVMDFYNKGGGAGIGIELDNQTLPDVPLDLSSEEIANIISFMESLTDTVGLTSVPPALPKFENQPEWNDRPIGGGY